MAGNRSNEVENGMFKRKDKYNIDRKEVGTYPPSCTHLTLPRGEVGMKEAAKLKLGNCFSFLLISEVTPYVKLFSPVHNLVTFSVPQF